eukprot:Tbor_TRINITY_DN5623_c7_g5::TRINITY_DN5623_c7_g5_i1::g.9140::m.9140
MVLLTVKGTKHADEFTFECDINNKINIITNIILHIQNMRFKVKNQITSWRELITTGTVKKAIETQGINNINNIINNYNIKGLYRLAAARVMIDDYIEGGKALDKCE